MDKSYQSKMKRALILAVLLVSFMTMAQRRVTLLFDNGMTVKDGFLEGGVQLDLPQGEYEFYLFGERNIVGIERFETIAQFRGVEKELIATYQDKLCDYMGKKGESCGDTEVAYEVHDSPMFGYCQVLYFYYENAMYTNRIGTMWTSMNDGDHTIFIVTHEGIYFTRKIRIRNGKLVEL